MARLSIAALGPLVVTLDGQPITGLAYDKVWALLVFLAHAPSHPHRREALGDAEASSPFLLTEHTGVQFNAASDAAFDVTEFTALLAACAAHAHRHAETCAERRERAVALYRGPFLDKFSVGDSNLFEEWVTLVREPLHQQALEALASLAAYHERHGDYARALRYSERQVELDPWREEAYRQSMRLLALTGQRSAALHCYERCRTVLDQELGVEPSAETTALYEQIRAAAFGGPPSTIDLALPTQRRYHLPLHPTPFLGREPELAALAELIADPHCRLITLLGPGGSGKSRLALQAAHNEGEAFADGATYVSLAPLNTAELLAPTVAAALGVTLTNRAAPQTELLRVLREKELLLVLDNFEHLLAPSSPASSSATELLAAILQQAPGVTLLVTSRERLNLQGKWVFDVSGLETPPQPDHAGEGLAALETYSAAALFLQTARRVQPGFTPSADDRAAIVRICRLVQGMPLALELAAAWAVGAAMTQDEAVALAYSSAQLSSLA